MAQKGLLRCSLVGAMCAGSFLAGTVYENYHKICFPREKVARLPALPLFGTVSAAAPFSTPPATTEVVSPTRISQIMKFGFPGLDTVRSFQDYVLSYDKRNKVAHWVFEHLTAENVKYNEGVDRSKCDFMVDQSIHPFFRYNCYDYTCWPTE